MCSEVILKVMEMRRVRESLNSIQHEGKSLFGQRRSHLILALIGVSSSDGSLMESLFDSLREESRETVWNQKRREDPLQGNWNEK
jgi:hypothetical protein